MSKRYLLGLGALLCAVAAPMTAAAQQVGERVAAVVNDDPISTFDIEQRMRLMIATQGLQVPDEALPQLRRQILQELVEEQLKLQEAERFDLVITDDELQEDLARIAASGGGSVESLQQDLARQGISISTLQQKLRAEIAWERLVRGRYGARVNVTDQEVDDTLNQLRTDVQQDQYLISEICLPMETQEQADQMYTIAMQMIEQMRQGAPFRALAQQYSACPSAARGGDLGWMLSTDLDPELSDIVTRLGVGNISRPIANDGMLKMLAVRQKRDPAQPGEPGYEVAYAGADASLGEEKAAAAFKKLASANPCTGNALSADVGEGVGVTILPMLPESAFQTVFHDVLAGLKVGQVSEVVESEGAYHAVMLCEKDEGLGLPTRRAVESQLESDELDLISRRYLRDVERDSAVEIRMSQEG
ncbi:peptidylprolyl isomerase [Parvularcula sp. LCG005]|uniref:peptidylprolyl isomerase n=1 Tax=Parvularcula sp. LCG005 TaxID=3078805 RepID=UPI0029436CE4|nr:peptidylprolyl isomerase [Parvularcula sp. LCG005]WOI52732.1 peptidylprolyl isomerase [Parvularcula sp. LCG005]